MITASYNIDPNSSVITTITINISTAYSTFSPNYYDIASYCPTGFTHFTPLTFTTSYLNTASSTLYLNCSSQYTGNNPRFGLNINFKAIRIA